MLSKMSPINSPNVFSIHQISIEKYMYDALWHFLDHGCGAAFFKYPEKLFELVQKSNPKNILEIGTGIGYSAYVMHCANPNAHIVTIEQESDHCEIAKQKLGEFKNIKVINAEAENVLSDYTDKIFDVIFYDGYAPRLMFLKEFERLLTHNGLLISANSQKKGSLERDGSTKQEFLNGLDDESVWQFQESFADVLVYKKISE